MSVNLPSGGGKKADKVDFVVPVKPFGDITIAGVDRAWLSARTGNTISYLSDCGGKSDPALERMRDEALGAFSDSEILEESRLDYNGREALGTTAKGRLDGVPVQIRLILFKKNGCQYTLSYGGVQKNFADEESVFQNFTEGFKAP